MSERTSQRYSARRRLRHFQQTLTMPLGRSAEAAESEAAIQGWAARPGSPRLDRAQFEHDVERIRLEGDPAIQDVLMRMEREAMAQALQDLRAIVDTLGPRAAAALSMIEVMFQTGILETSTLSRETLLKMGFVTKDFTGLPQD